MLLKFITLPMVYVLVSYMITNLYCHAASSVYLCFMVLGL